MGGWVWGEGVLYMSVAEGAGCVGRGMVCAGWSVVCVCGWMGWWGWFRLCMGGTAGRWVEMGGR